MHQPMTLVDKDLFYTKLESMYNKIIKYAQQNKQKWRRNYSLATDNRNMAWILQRAVKCKWFWSSYGFEHRCIMNNTVNDNLKEQPPSKKHTRWDQPHESQPGSTADVIKKKASTLFIESLSPANDDLEQWIVARWLEYYIKLHCTGYTQTANIVAKFPFSTLPTKYLRGLWTEDL